MEPHDVGPSEHDDLFGAGQSEHDDLFSVGPQHQLELNAVEQNGLETSLSSSEFHVLPSPHHGNYGTQFGYDLDSASDMVGRASNRDWTFVGEDGLAGNAISHVEDEDFEECSRSEPVLSASQFQMSFSRDLLMNCTATSSIVMPWERGVFRQIFSDEAIEVSVPQMPLDDFDFGTHLDMEPRELGEVVASAASFSHDLPVFMSVISHTDDVDHSEKLSMQRERALSKLLVVIEFALDASSTGRHISSACGGRSMRADAFQILDAVVGLRSPHTILKRANALQGFLQWCAHHRIGGDNPFNEETLWAYLSDLRDNHASPTKGESVLSAMRFARYVLGFETLDPAMNSRRLAGLRELMAAGKRTLRQAKVLTVHQVLQLHSMLLNDSTHNCDRALCAYFLLALYGRCRHSDLLMIHSAELDLTEHGGFIVVRTSCHKTGRTAALKSTLLPIIIPARGVDGSVYGRVAMDIFSRLGVDTYSTGGRPLLPAPVGDGNFMRRGMSSKESSE